MLYKDKKARKPHRLQTCLLESIKISLEANYGAFVMLGEFPRMFPELIVWKF